MNMRQASLYSQRRTGYRAGGHVVLMVDGILVLRCCSLNIPVYVLETTAQQKIPAMFESAFWVKQGALVSYGSDYYVSGKLVAPSEQDH